MNESWLINYMSRLLMKNNKYPWFQVVNTTLMLEDWNVYLVYVEKLELSWRFSIEFKNYLTKIRIQKT